MQEADVAPATTDSAATQDNRPAPTAGCDYQAAPNLVDTDTDEEDCLAGMYGRSGQPSSHGAAEASTSGLPDSSATEQAAGAQQQQGRRRLRTAVARLLEQKGLRQQGMAVQARKQLAEVAVQQPGNSTTAEDPRSALITHLQTAMWEAVSQIMLLQHDC